MRQRTYSVMQTGKGEGGREPGRGGGGLSVLENRRGTISICENTERSKKEGGEGGKNAHNNIQNAGGRGGGGRGESCLVFANRRGTHSGGEGGRGGEDSTTDIFLFVI
jgi:hypothetical protein